MPSMSEVIEGTEIAKLREIEIEDLLGREIVEPENKLTLGSILGKVSTNNWSRWNDRF